MTWTWLGQMEQSQVAPQLLYTEVTTCVDIYNYVCVDIPPCGVYKGHSFGL